MLELNEKIPNNVGLSDNPKLKRALESWQPKYLEWWQEMGPEGYQENDIYLRTAISVEAGGWANFDYVKMPDYRWGIFMAPPADRNIGFGDSEGKSLWNDVPGEFRKELRRIIVTQADTEPASVEQQRLLGKSAPSLYDMRNLFQVNVEEGRHLWAMVYLLHTHFGRDGRDEADELLERRSGHPDTPRILGAFNEPISNWLDFFCFAMFADRDGKYQLAALAESSFDPLARSTQFMLTEEAHHLFVGETGIGRIIERTVELMKESPNEDVAARGGIPLDLLQRYINRWFSVCLDLFGGEDSSNAATFFAQGLKGRYKESDSKRHADHQALEQTYIAETAVDGRLSKHEIPMRRAMNAVLQDAYIEDCARAMKKWNGILERAGLSTRLALPSRRFHREVGLCSDQFYSPTGEVLTKDQFNARAREFLPTPEDTEHVEAVQVAVYEPGKMAGWIAPPKTGINRQPLDFEYVRVH